MSQNKIDYSQNPSGVQLMDNFLAKSQENFLTSNSGIKRPVYAKKGTVWLDTSVNPARRKMFDGSKDIDLSSSVNFEVYGTVDITLPEGVQ